jgi:hypothetical protein
MSSIGPTCAGSTGPVPPAAEGIAAASVRAVGSCFRRPWRRLAGRLPKSWWGGFRRRGGGALLGASTTPAAPGTLAALAGGPGGLAGIGGSGGRQPHWGASSSWPARCGGFTVLWIVG